MTLHIAFELSKKNWKLGFSTEGMKNPRIINIAAGDTRAFQQALYRTLEHFNLSKESTRILSVYEAGRDGFWIHRWLESLDIESRVVDPASIDVPRRKRRAKTDSIDVKLLLNCSFRYESGDLTTWAVLRIPAPEQEDERRREREIKRTKKERSGHITRIKSLLFMHGVVIENLTKLPEQLAGLRTWDGEELPTNLLDEILREYERYKLCCEQIKVLEKQRNEILSQPISSAEKIATSLHNLYGVGVVSSMILSFEFFGWREFKNVREVGAYAGLVGSPYQSGDSNVEQGISKEGNALVRSTMIELAWCWLRFQPESELSQWFMRRFAMNGKRQRRIGIVALARKLLVSFWKYLKLGEVPKDARLRLVS